MDGIRKKILKKYSKPIQYTEEIPYFQLYPQKKQSFKPLLEKPQKKEFCHTYSLTKKPSRKKRISLAPFIFRIILIFLLILASCSAGALGYFFWKVKKTTEYITENTAKNSDFIYAAKNMLPSLEKKTLPLLRGQEDGRINVLLLGKASKEYPGQNLTDTIMIASIDTKTMQTALLSIPRDMQIQMPGSKNFVKINSIYSIARNEVDPSSIIRKSIETITGIPIHYYVIIDYRGFEQVIDAIGGIHIQVDRDIYDPRYPGPNYSYELFELSKGFHTLDGATALKYVRERHSDPQGDFGRAYRQQQVIESVKNRVFSIKTFLNPFTFNTLLDALGNNVRTNILPNEIESFINLVKKSDTQNISNVVIDAWKKNSLLRVSHVALENGQSMFILIPRTGNYSEIQDVAKNIFHKEEQSNRMKELAKEAASVAIINYSTSPLVALKVKSLIETIGMSAFLFPANKKILFSETTVIDTTTLKKPYSLDEIIKKIPAKNSHLAKEVIPSEIQLQSNNADIDFVLFIGEDIVSQYNWNEASIEEYQQSENYDL